jgi:hypothetical protein
LNLPKSRKCPLLISNSNFKIEAEFEKVFIEKVVGFEKLSNFCFYRFSTFIENLKVILNFLSVVVS